MIIIDDLTYESLADQETRNGIRAEIDKYIELNNVSDAKELLEKLEQLFKGNQSTDLYRQYNPVFIQLKFLCLPVLTVNEAAALLGSSLTVGLQMGIDVFDKLDDLLNFYRDEYSDFESHKQIAMRIASNKERIGSKKIFIKGEASAVDPTIANWIRDFSSTLPINTTPSYIEEAEYLSQNSNVKALSKSEADLLKKTLRLYNYLRFPVRQSDRVQKTGHKVGKVITGPSDDSVKVTLPADPVERLKAKYNNYRRARWNVLKLEDEILMQTKGDNEALKKELSAAAREYNSQKLIACIKILGRQNALLESLRQSPSWQHSLKDYIISKYAPTSEPEDISYVVERLNENYRNPAIISEFLQYLFVDKLKMEENDAALTAIEIGQLLGPDYELIAYGDQETGNFVFSKNKIENKELVMEK